MSFAEWAKYKTKYSSQSYNPKTFGTDFTYGGTKYDPPTTILEKIEDLKKRLQSPYLNHPTMGEVEKILSLVVIEINKLQKEKQELDKRVTDLIKQNDETSNSLAQEFYDTKDNIEIHFNDETVTIEGELATQVVNLAVKQFIVEALEKACQDD